MDESTRERKHEGMITVTPSPPFDEEYVAVRQAAPAALNIQKWRDRGELGTVMPRTQVWCESLLSDS